MKLVSTALALTLAAAAAAAPTFTVPVTYYKLPNGLRVILSPDHTAPTVAVAVYYRIGFRVEPRDRLLERRQPPLHVTQLVNHPVELFIQATQIPQDQAIRFITHATVLNVGGLTLSTGRWSQSWPGARSMIRFCASCSASAAAG